MPPLYHSYICTLITFTFDLENLMWCQVSTTEQNRCSQTHNGWTAGQMTENTMPLTNYCLQWTHTDWTLLIKYHLMASFWHDISSSVSCVQSVPSENSHTAISHSLSSHFPFHKFLITAFRDRMSLINSQSCNTIALSQPCWCSAALTHSINTVNAHI